MYTKKREKRRRTGKITSIEKHHRNMTRKKFILMSVMDRRRVGTGWRKRKKRIKIWRFIIQFCPSNQTLFSYFFYTFLLLSLLLLIFASSTHSYLVDDCAVAKNFSFFFCILEWKWEFSDFWCQPRSESNILVNVDWKRNRRWTKVTSTSFNETEIYFFWFSLIRIETCYFLIYSNP